MADSWIVFERNVTVACRMAQAVVSFSVLIFEIPTSINNMLQVYLYSLSLSPGLFLLPQLACGRGLRVEGHFVVDLLINLYLFFRPCLLAFRPFPLCLMMSPWLRFLISNLAWRSNCESVGQSQSRSTRRMKRHFDLLTVGSKIIVLELTRFEFLPAIPEVPKFGYHRDGKSVAVKPQCFPQASRVKMNWKLVHWFNSCMCLSIGLSCLMALILLCFQVPKRVPKTAKLPKKGTLVKKPMFLKSYGTIRAGLCVDLLRDGVFQTNIGWGPFSATTRANTTYLSKRGSQDNCHIDIIAMCFLDVASHAFYIVFGSRTLQIKSIGQKVFLSPAQPKRLTRPSSSMSTQKLQSG